MAVLALASGIHYYLSTVFAPPDDGRQGVPPGAGQPLVGPANPGYAVASVYAVVGNDDPGLACGTIVSADGGRQLARDLGAGSDCEAAVHFAHRQVVDQETYSATQVPLGAVHMTGPKRATVNSCAMAVEGGPSLGAFVVENLGNGWVVTGHSPDPSPCPPPAQG
ncbi:hypothetical protein [Kutzneria buriramensis]|nr:hypothetical protein [Kutzneria buriramensis]